ncbi:DUF3679 domain-containing protein [Aquibacillus sediminis]|uniref:DUF3679 domain-containing protein n=1 Tax=Aquibacillus sediminis TaxID=2574734 RepID=UPI0011082402|nr:DUF3679 domain-containing protein [Aquibacillus sediminis]
MAKFIITLLIMIILFLGGVLFGIDQASEGVTSVRGYTDSTVEKAVETNKTEQGAHQVKVMGRDFQQVNLEEKQQEYEQMESSHFIQTIAGGLEHGVQWFYNKMIISVYQLVQAFF